MKRTRGRPRPVAGRAARNRGSPRYRHARRRNLRGGVSVFLAALQAPMLIASAVGLVLGWLEFFGGLRKEAVAISVAALAVSMIVSAPGSGRADRRTNIRRMGR